MKKLFLFLLLVVLPLTVNAKDSVSILYYKNIGNCETETCTSESYATYVFKKHRL